MPDKLRAVEQLAKLCGFNEPEKMEIDHGYKAQQELMEVIARLRGRERHVTIRVLDKLAR